MTRKSCFVYEPKQTETTREIKKTLNVFYEIINDKSTYLESIFGEKKSICMKPAEKI